MRKFTTLAALFAAALALQSCATTPPTPVDAATAHIETLPAAPEGYKWVVNEEFSDEFNGDDLNEEIWYRKSPYWTNGRAPATFKADAVSQKDGYLQITNYALDKPEGNDGQPGDKYHFAGGAVASKSKNAHYGYYETRMKASQTPMSSTFWLKIILPEKKPFTMADGRTVNASSSQELDIIETVGVITPETIEQNAKNVNWNAQMNSNIHYNFNSEEVKFKKLGERTNIECETTAPSSEAFHTYGCWWVDAKTVKFYYDGKYMYSMEAPTDITETPLDNPMYMHLVTETYDWVPGVTAEHLADPAKATTKYDWVRSYKLVKE